MADNDVMIAEPIKAPVKNMDGAETGETVDLDPRLFGLPRNDHVLYLAVKTEMANRRQGTASTKSRAEVRGGGKKPWRQKGRGAARVGTIRSPLWRGGGIIFGPKPHAYDHKLPRKVRRLARRIALSVKAQAGAIDLVDLIKLDEPKTAKIATMLEKFQASGSSVLLLTDATAPNLVMSCRNIPRVEVRECLTASALDILRARKIIIVKSALDALAGAGGLIDA